jgi:hypothetical protein
LCLHKFFCLPSFFLIPSVKIYTKKKVFCLRDSKPVGYFGFSRCKLPPESKNVHDFCLWRSVLTILVYGGFLRKQTEKILKFHEFFIFFYLAVKFNFHAHFSNQRNTRKVPYLFVGQPQIFTLL